MSTQIVGTVLADRYRIVEPLSSGGMGAVYVGVDENLNRRVAIKVIRPELAQEEQFTERLRREAMVVGSIAHPHIVQPTDFGKGPHGEPFIVMELLEGEPMSDTLKRERRLEVPRAVFIADQILDALSAAHAADVVHRDLKPANVFLTRLSAVGDVVKLLDFGTAKLQQSMAFKRLTRTGQVVGTPAWMAPEYARGEEVDGRADLYGVGLILYRALAGELPFRVEHQGQWIAAIQEQIPPPLSQFGIEAALDAVVRRALAKVPHKRFATADDMRAAIAPWLELRESRPSHAPPAPAAGRIADADSTAPPTVAARPVRARNPTPLALERPSWTGDPRGSSPEVKPPSGPDTGPTQPMRRLARPLVAMSAGFLAVALIAGGLAAWWLATRPSPEQEAATPLPTAPPVATAPTPTEESTEPPAPIPTGVDPPPAEEPFVEPASPPAPRVARRRRPRGSPALVMQSPPEPAPEPEQPDRDAVEAGGVTLVDPFAD